MSAANDAHRLQQTSLELQQTERLSLDQITQLQSRQLASLIEHHVRHTPAFSARLRRAKLSARDIDSVVKLERLPLLARRDIQNLGASFYSKQVPADHEPTGSIITSGSTGEPIRVLKSRLCRYYWGANTARDHRWNRRDVTGRLMSIRPTMPGRTEAESWGFPMAVLGRTGRSLGLPTSMDLTEHVRCVDEFEPQTLLTFPNVLSGLLDEWERRGSAPPSLHHLKTIGETVRIELRERAQRVCGLRIEDSYSSQECGIIAIQCPASGLYHVMAESLIVEVLDDTGQPCEPGQMGRLVITDLRNFASPLLRYEIGDVAIRSEPCRCGLALPTLQRILGRDRNLLVRPDGSRRYPTVGFQQFHTVAPVLQFRFIQHSLLDLEMIVHTLQPLDVGQQVALVKVVQNALGYPFEMRITHSATPLPRSTGGKFEDFISKVPA